MRTILLTIEYDGTAYSGWQFQPNGLTVQQVIEEALAKILAEDVRVHASGRTDAGVHARGMCAHFQTEKTLPLKAFRDGVNSHLPRDVVIRRAEEKNDDFHARFSARGKWYRYTIYHADVRSPLADRTSWNLKGNIDLELMKTAAQYLVGEHDFSAFRSSGCVAKTTVREIFQVDVLTNGCFLYIDFRGSGFLKNMVRMLVGTLVEIAQHKRPPEDIKRLLNSEEGLVCGSTAPAKGLCLQEVWY